MIFLIAPLDVQKSPAYGSALSLLTGRYGPEGFSADRDLFSDMKDYNQRWKEVYDPQEATALYVLAREDGTIGSGTYRQWKRLAKKHGVPATLLLPDEEKAAEVGDFTVSLIEKTERSERVFALVSPESQAQEPASARSDRRTSSGTERGGGRANAR